MTYLRPPRKILSKAERERIRQRLINRAFEEEVLMKEEDMNPKNVQLNFTQKVQVLLKAIDDVIPLSLLACLAIGLAAGIYIPTLWPFIDKSNLIDFFVRRILGGALMAAVFFLISGGLLAFYENVVLDIVQKVKDKYETRANEMKKKILDNVIDEEILK